jgi:hypothetical protein
MKLIVKNYTVSIKRILELVYFSSYSIEDSDEIERSVEYLFIPYLLTVRGHFEAHTVFSQN